MHTGRLTIRWIFYKNCAKSFKIFCLHLVQFARKYLFFLIRHLASHMNLHIF